MSDPLADFRNGLRQLAASVAVVTCGEGSAAAGMTVTSVVSLSFDPPSLIVCVNRNARLSRRLREDRGFRVSWLACGQEEVARAFSRPGASQAERFAAGAWRPAACGPSLCGALAEACCELEQALDYGTHTLFVARVTAAGAAAGEPLLYRDGAYAALAR